MKEERVQETIDWIELTIKAMDRNTAKIAEHNIQRARTAALIAAKIKQRERIALKALRKQLAKQPVKHKTQKGMILCCPDCGKRIYRSAQYCSRCGQRLKAKSTGGQKV